MTCGRAMRLRSRQLARKRLKKAQKQVHTVRRLSISWTGASAASAAALLAAPDESASAPSASTHGESERLTDDESTDVRLSCRTFSTLCCWLVASVLIV